MSIAPYCICVTVSEKSLQALLEVSGRGTYRDDHPWLIARELLTEAERAGSRMPILLATGNPPAGRPGPASRFTHWGYVESIEVVELHRATWETACRFTPLKPVNPIFEAIDSVFLKPTAEQLARERLEGIHRHRYPVTEAELRPYAIGETPAFIEMET